MRVALFLLGICCCAGARAEIGQAAAGAVCDRVTVGAIRWDAWHGVDDSVGLGVEETLGKPKWKNRWPVFQRDDGHAPEFDGTGSAVVESEKSLAKEAGIDYWAFGFNGSASPMSRFLNRYLESKSEGPRFSLILDAQIASRPVRGDVIADEVAALASDARYLRAIDDRPVVFVFYSSENPPETYTLPAIEKLKHAFAKKAGAKEPYVVVLAFHPARGAAIAAKAGVEAISTYAWRGNSLNGKYADLVKGTEKQWSEQSDTGLPVIAVLMSGWDPRPRYESPQPWAPRKSGEYYQKSRPSELRDHVAKGLKWAKTRSNGGCSALIYAWNEFDEGGWIAPTIGDGESRLKAVREAIQEASAGAK